VAERTVLLTGATGFLGVPTARRLADAGWRVRGLVRPGRALPPGIDPAPVAGLDDRDGIRRAMEGAHAVVHLAARVHVMRDRAADPLAEFRRVNVDGTRMLLDAAAGAGVERFVFASSVKAVGETSAEPWTEDTPPRPADPYGVSKLEAERAVAAADGAGAMRTTTLRLPLAYGPNVRGNVLSLFGAVWRGLPLPLAGVENRRSLLFAGNFAAAAQTVLVSPAAAGQLFCVGDGVSVSTPGLVRMIAAALGRPARLVPYPARLLRAAARAGDVLSRAVPFPLTSAAVARLSGSLEVDPSRLARMTGFVPPYTMQQGLAETAAWYRSTRGPR
jgi:nucleoside-diphosphate-sugar epimerase